jgi:hypothetical protein
MLIITETRSINTDHVTCIEINTNRNGRATIYADNRVIISGYNDVITKDIYDDIIYSITSGKKSYNVSAHMANILKQYSYREVVL